MNNHLGTTPWSFYGLIPGTSKEEFKGRLAGFGTKGDNRVTDLSVAYRIQLGTGGTCRWVACTLPPASAPTNLSGGLMSLLCANAGQAPARSQTTCSGRTSLRSGEGP